MSKTFSIIDNQIIVNPGSVDEINITEEGLECDFCVYENRSCGKYHLIEKYGYCDHFRMNEEYEEVY